MADEEVMRFILEAAVKGVSSSTADIEKFQSSLDELAKSGEITGAALDKFSSKLRRKNPPPVDGKNVAAIRKEAAELEKLGEAREKLDRAKDTNTRSGMSQQEGAAARLEAANKRVADTQERYNKITQSGHGNTASQTKVTKDLTSAYNELTSATEAQSQSDISLRYIHYDLAAAYGAVSAALTGMGVLTVKTFADVEQGFANVERVMGSDVSDSMIKEVENDIRSLSKEIPTATESLQDFATRGAQMGIATEKVSEFSEVMAKFSATSPEVNVNTLAESFGRLANLTGSDDFEAMASAIAKVGINSAATDAEIIKTTQELARATSATSLTADEVIGLSAAFASLAVRPEAARGVMNQFLVQIEKGTAGLNDSMKVAARVMGTTEEAAVKLFKTSAGDFFQQFVTGLAGVENATVVLDEMGLQGQRLIPAFNALTADVKRNADGNTILANAMRDANEGFRDRNELERQYAPMAATLQARTQILKNSLADLAYAIGLQVAPALSAMVDAISNVVQGISKFVDSPIGGFITRIVAALLTMIAAYTGLRATIELTAGAASAFKSALDITGRTGIVASLGGVTKAFRGTGAAATGAAAGVSTFRRALSLLARATIILGAIQAVIWVLEDIPRAAGYAGKALVWVAQTAQRVAAAIKQFVSAIPLIGGALSRTFGAVEWLNNGTEKLGRRMLKWASENKKTEKSVGDLGGASTSLADYMGDVEDAAGGAGDALGGGGGVADKAKEAQREIRTLSDYASDLAQVMSRAFEIRFSGANAADEITKTFNDLKKATEDAKQKVKDLRDEIRSLQADLGVLGADISTKKYFLSIAIEYGDTKRAEVLQADIAKLEADRAQKQSDLAKKQKELTDAQNSNSKSLKGNSEQAIQNRSTIQGLVQAYQKQIEALAKSGMSQDKLKKKTAELRADFIRQATQLGFNRDELRKYEAGFDDAAIAIAKVPRNVTIEADVNPAITALKELQAEAQKTSDALSGAGSGGGLGGGGGIGGGGGGLGDLGDFGEMLPEDALSEDTGEKTGNKWVEGFLKALSYFPSKVGEFFASLPEKIRGVIETAGTNVGKFFTETVPGWMENAWNTIVTWFKDLPGKIGYTVGYAGSWMWETITKDIPEFFGKAFGRMSEWFRSLPERIGSFAKNAGNAIWTYITGTLPNKLSNAWTGFKNWIASLPAKARTFAESSARSIWTKLTNFGNAFNNALTNIKNWFINLPSRVWNTVKNAASDIWSNFASGFASGAASQRRSSSTSYPSRANGGYAGPGAKFKPAGVYHAGEYVIPKRDVNQTTGIPYASALGRLMRGSPGYANGGGTRAAASSSGGNGLIDLSDQTIRRLARAVQTEVSLDGKMIGEAASRSYARDNRVGAN